MSYGAPDRGGGREGKKGSLRKSKVNAAEAAKKAQAKPREERPETSPAPPPVALPPLPARATSSEHLADCFVNLVSRQFDRDREAVLRRAREASVAFCVVASADAEKQGDVAKLCREFVGTLYCVAGALPDNIKKACNEKQLAAWVAAVTDVALSPECVAVQTGLDLGREAATHHAQERLFDMHAALAKRVGLPLLVSAAPGSGSLQRCTELLAALGSEPPRFALLNAALHCADAEEGEESPLDAWRAAGGWLVVSGALLSEPDAPGAAAAAARLGAFAKQPEALLLATGAPQHTPQTLTDSYLRTMRNEPSNLPQILEDLAAAADIAPAAPLAQALWRNSLQFFALAPAADAAGAASAPASSPAKAKQLADEPASSPAKASAPAVAGVAESSGSEDDEEEAAAPARRPNASAFAQLALDEGDENASGALSSTSSDAEEVEPDEALSARHRAATLPRTEQAAGEAEGSQWACRRCRARLFAPSAVVWHGVGGERAAFAAQKTADDNACLASVFVECASARSLAALGLASADGGDGGAALKLACARCGTKLGRFAGAAQPCSCGALVPGPAAKLTSARLDFVDAHAAGDALRLRGELDAAAGADRDAEAAAQAEEAKRRKEAHHKPKLAKASGGNFSNYRNKTT